MLLPDHWDYGDFESHLRIFAFLKTILLNASLKTTDDFYRRVIKRSVLLLDCIDIVGTAALERLPAVERVKNSLPNQLALVFSEFALKVYCDNQLVSPHKPRISKQIHKILLNRQMEFIVFTMIFGSESHNLNWDFTSEKIKGVSTVMHNMLTVWENQTEMQSGSYNSDCEKVIVFLKILCHIYDKANRLETITHDTERAMYSHILSTAFAEYKILVE